MVLTLLRSLNQDNIAIILNLGVLEKKEVPVLMELESGKRYFIAYRTLLDRLEQVSQNLAMTEIEGLKYTEIKKETHSK